MTSSSTTPSSASPGRILASFAAQAQSVSLPDVVRSKTLIQILDSLAAISSGSALEAGRQAQTYVRARFPPSAGYPANHYEASVLGTDIRCPVVEAALAMGMAAHADESDDSHETSQTHPGCGVLPAVLAVAQWVGSSGEEFVKAVNLGYEVTIRFGRYITWPDCFAQSDVSPGEALVPLTSFAKSSLSNHAVAPLFGAAFACGSLLSFSTNQYLILLNYLAQEASGLTTWRLDKAHTLKSYVFAGMPASNAVKCVLLVHSGWTGAGDVLGGDPNFFDALSGGAAGGGPRIGRVQNGGLGREDGGWGVQTSGLGLNGEEREWKILETDIKKYSVGFPIAAPLAALEEIMARTNAVHSQVRTRLSW
jgi:2-methylcitrate dehydratase PrpD